ncbi:hypothetical protein [Algoriphagus marincola]|uniref:hypothetical protein n=1 Tax=Algoriphagus marincola TaxID=264027 RepID=UPI000401C530|nr:hypothetical protein [Algoriphagus marincola]
MKRLLAIIGIASIFAFQACEGPMGPPGPPGLDGLDGVNIVGEAFEVEVDFTEANDYREIFEFDPEIFESDVVLAYVLWETNNGTPIWRPLPQNIFFQEGVLIYNYDFSQFDFSVFLDGPIDYSLLADDWTQNQIFRIIVVPADFAGSRIDFSDYEAVTKLLEIEENDFIKLSPKPKQ